MVATNIKKFNYFVIVEVATHIVSTNAESATIVDVVTAVVSIGDVSSTGALVLQDANNNKVAIVNNVVFM